MFLKHRQALVVSSAPGGVYICPNDLVWKTGVCEHTETIFPLKMARSVTKWKTNWQFIWLLCLASCAVGSLRRQWWRRPQTLEEKEKRRAHKEDSFQCSYFDLWHCFFWIGSIVFSNKFLEPIGNLVRLNRLNIIIWGLMEIVRRCKKTLHRPAIIHNQCFSLF